MCTILIAHQVFDQLPLLVLANRDEFYSRPTASAAEWQEFPGMIAGRDLLSGGTWFGARNQRWASITNVREGRREKHGHHKSRGWLVLDYLQGNLHPEAFFLQTLEKEDQFAGYNLLLGDGSELWYASNRGTGVRHLTPGIYGLSNALLDTPWPKVLKGKAALEKMIHSSAFDREAALSILSDTTTAPDKDLPDTGVPYEWEKALSATFITLPDYGTRCSTLLTCDQNKSYHFVERRYLDGPQQWEESHFSWHV